MFEGVVASLLNKYLGKYIQDLDSENLNVGIFSGDVELYDLRLKPEALAELNLPIEVKAGFVGKLTLTIPWTQLYTAPVIVAVEELFVLAGPTTDREYDEAKEKQLARAHKRVILDRLEVLPTEERDPTFLEKLAATVINNLQIFIRNIHIRYEDTVTERKSPLAVGITLHNLSAETTNSKWKITQIESEATSIYKILKLEELTMYWMPLVAHDQLLSTVTDVTYWRELMRQSLVTHAFEGEKFDFVLKPLSAVAKVIMNKSEDTNVPKLLVDFVVPDMSLSIGRQQFLSLVSVLESFQMIEVNRQFRQYRPNVPPPHNSAKWWHYAYNSIVNEYIRPYSWERIRQHRARYRQYKELYKQRLHRLKDTELLVDLQRQEDQLDVPNILMAREQAKLEMSRTSPHRVRRVPPKPAASSWFGGGAEEEEEEEGEGGEVYVPAEVESAALWSKLSPEEKQVLCTAIGYAGDCDAAAAVRGARPAQYIEHKVNLTVANCTVALLNRGKDILVLSWCNLLCSLENRPAADAYRISARTESFLVEGASIEHDLVPVLTADNTVGTKGNRAPHVFSLDLEAKPTHVQADFAVSLLLEPVELVYHEHAMSELVGFLQLPTLALSEVRETAAGIAKEAVHYTKAGLLYAIETHKTVHFSVDIKSPYLVIPEYGTLQRGGTVLVIDIGRLRLDSHLQPKNASLEDATMTEIEERLYDKFSLSLSGLQVLFAYPGADWHSAQLEQESEMHIIPSLILQMNLFNSIKQDVTAMPKQKLFVTVPALKLNVSDEKLLLLLEFLRNIPLPSLSGYEDLDLTEVDAPLREIREPSVLLKKNTDMKYQPTLQQLRKMRTAVHCNSVASGRDQLDRARRRMPEDSGELFFSSSDVSEDEEDIGAKGHAIVDESATSSNAVQRLLRFVLGEFVVHVSRSVAHADKPYLMLRADRLRSDVALMAYGVAVHASLGGVQLVDKINTGSSGEYLEMASSRGSDGELISVVYRQVRTDCPDLKDAYNNTLRHLAVRFNSLSVVIDKTASMYLRRFIRGLKKKVFEEKKELPITSPAVPQPSELLKLKNVSSAIVQLSANIHLADVDMKLCDQKTEYAQVRLAGFEAGISLKKARTSVHLSLAGLTVNCCQPGSLYPDILTMEENSIFDFKYVSYHSRDVITRNRPIPVDHKLDVKVGRVRAIYLHRFTVELMNFFEPFLTKEDVTSAVVNVEQTAARQVRLARTTLATCLIGHKGVLNFAGSVEVVHTILEPIMFVVNMKHGLPPYHPQVLRWDVSGKLDLIKISLHHDDLKTLLAIQAENFAEGSNNNRVMSPSLRPSKKLKRDDIVQPSNMISEVITDDTEEEQEVYQLTNVKLSLEGIDITLVENSGDLINLEPASDFGQSLAQLVVDKFVMSAANFSDSSAEVKCTLEAISLLDVRPQETIVIRKIFSSHSGNMKFDSEMINVTCPPMIDLTFKQSKDKDMVFDLVMERMRCNISVPYLLAIATFFQKAQLPASTPAAVITPAPKSSLAGVSMAQKYFSYYPEEGGGSLAVFCNLKKSEMVLFANPDESHSKILVMRMELMVDYSNKATQDNLVASIGGLELLCCNYASRCPGYTVLEPCQIELTRCILSETSGVEMNVSLSAVNFHLSMTTITIVTDVLACLNSGKVRWGWRISIITQTFDSHRFTSNKNLTMWAVVGCFT
ncbi:PREDICTED: vacuolar protein sorting-associated protein 13A-like [Priapulus caudatus]|uniref:Vacuolar protein sorting-associated protein 13A-like n=1 Tax=Priapulus caudatus TaxID=37621 RepID=A0ABM1ERY1_PRICU|nr:PREDICTED: vacuolar protein sorting-associated protein 13A-like [Priapulus caudatus]